MEAVLFYGVPAGCSFGATVALEWLDIPYRLCRIDMMERPWPPQFTAINPLNLTPSFLTEDDRIINESAAILGHLAARKDKLLGYRQGTPEFDRLNEALAYLNTEFFWSFRPLWTAYEMEEDPPHQAMLREMGQPAVARACAHLDRLLAGRAWIDGGDKRTVADAYFIAIARWAEYHGVHDAQAYPHLQRHMDKLRADPAVVFADDIEQGRHAASTGRCLGHVTLDEVAARLAR